MPDLKQGLSQALANSRRRLEAKRFVRYRLRDPDTYEIFGGDEVDERLAAMRAQELADYYGHAIEVCQVIGGLIIRQSATTVAFPGEPSRKSR